MFGITPIDRLVSVFKKPVLNEQYLIFGEKGLYYARKY